MNEYVIGQKLARLEKQMDSMEEIMKTIESRLSAEENLWDNSDIVRHWKVSPRTLAEWRKQGLIEFIKVNGKIYYTPQARAEFISRHSINANEASKMYGRALS